MSRTLLNRATVRKICRKISIKPDELKKSGRNGRYLSGRERVSGEDKDEDGQENDELGGCEKEAHIEGAEVGRSSDDVHLVSNKIFPAIISIFKGGQDMRLLPAALFDHFGKGILPSVHLDDSHPGYDLIHRPDPFIRPLSRFQPEPRKDFAHPTCKMIASSKRRARTMFRGL